MTKISEALMAKLSARDIGDADERIWALPKERVMPLDTGDMIKASSLAMDAQVNDMTPAQRLMASRRICARAGEEGVKIAGMACKYSGSRLSPHFRAFMAMRKEATCHLHDHDIDRLIATGQAMGMKDDIDERVKGLDKMAAAVEYFDRKYGIDGSWGHWMPDPAYTVYGQTADRYAADDEGVKFAGFEIDARGLDAIDWPGMSNVLPGEVIEGMASAEDKTAVFSSLPDPEKEIITQALVANGAG